jgi:hypothetical protein
MGLKDQTELSISCVAVGRGWGSGDRTGQKQDLNEIQCFVVLRVAGWTGLLEQPRGNPRAPPGGVGSRAGEAGWGGVRGASGRGHHGRCAVRCGQGNPKRDNPRGTVRQEITAPSDSPSGHYVRFFSTHPKSGTAKGISVDVVINLFHSEVPRVARVSATSLLAPIRVGPRQFAEKGAQPSQKAGTPSGRMKQWA